MKANYLQRNRSKRAYLKRIFLLLVIFVIGALILPFFSAGIIAVFSPIWKAENSLVKSLGNKLAFFSSRKALVEENAALKERLSVLEAQILSISRDSVSGSALLELAGRKPRENALVAAVLTYPPETPYDIIIIDAGTDESVSNGLQVALPDGSLLGEVSEVFSQSAKVKLFSAVGEETNAVLERGQVPVTLIGRGGGNFRLSLPRDTIIEKGDVIVSPDINSRILAIVKEAIVRPTDSFKEVLAKSPANIFTLRFVFVIP